MFGILLLALAADGVREDSATQVEPVVASSADHPHSREAMGDSTAPGDRSTPSNIHLTWDQQSGSDATVVVAWATADSGSSAVQYGLTNAYGTHVTASTFYSSACDQYISEARLSGLVPNTLYHYRCGSPGSWSGSYTFRSGLPRGSTTPFTFVAYGDSRTDWDQADTVATAVLSNGPAFVLHAGDFVPVGEYQSDWDQWFSVVDDLVATTAHMGMVGNHDLRYGGAGHGNYTDQFAFPNNEEYYSFDYGNAHFVCVYLPEEASEVPDTSAQYQWLMNDLAAADADRSIRWKFAWWHVPPYAASPAHWAHDTTIINQGFPLLEQYGVQIVFQGHCHNYERTYMLKGDAVAQYGPLFANPRGGVISVITGGAGAPLHNVGTEWWTACSERAYHFCKVTIDDNWLTLEAVSDDGTTVLDSFTVFLDETLADLRAYWRFENKAGTSAVDRSGYGNTGSVAGASQTPIGPTGRALEFDGVDDYVQVANSPSLIDPGEQVTLLAWVKTSAGEGHNHTVLEKWFYDECAEFSIHDRSFLLRVHETAKIEFGLSSDGSPDSSVSLVSTGTVNLGAWTHVAAVCDGESMRVYIDGAADPGVAEFSSRIHPSGHSLHIGRLRAVESNGAGWHDPFEGVLDEVRAYARVER
jgi:hypothetical protein